MSEYGVYRCRNIGMSEYWGVRIVGSLETNFNGRNIGLSEYWAVGILGCRNIGCTTFIRSSVDEFLMHWEPDNLGGVRGGALHCMIILMHRDNTWMWQKSQCLINWSLCIVYRVNTWMW